MDNAKIKEFYAVFDNWLNQHSHRDRLFILIAGWIIIYLLWYQSFEKSVLAEIDQHHTVIAAHQKEYQVFQDEIQQITAKGKSVAEQKKREAVALKNDDQSKIPLASQKDIDVIVQAILTPQENVRFLSLDNTSANPETGKLSVKNNVQLSFSSDYFGTINYLTQLEKLPWCLSWDSLEYKVANYPEAVVVINLHIVNS
ncbi:MAG: hypothetical protein V4501_08865 [Pseudomonadota bacterium]